jgi:hypothetical protein
VVAAAVECTVYVPFAGAIALPIGEQKRGHVVAALLRLVDTSTRVSARKIAELAWWGQWRPGRLQRARRERIPSSSEPRAYACLPWAGSEQKGGRALVNAPGPLVSSSLRSRP